MQINLSCPFIERHCTNELCLQLFVYVLCHKASCLQSLVHEACQGIFPSPSRDTRGGGGGGAARLLNDNKDLALFGTAPTFSSTQGINLCSNSKQTDSHFAWGVEQDLKKKTVPQLENMSVFWPNLCLVF